MRARRLLRAPAAIAILIAAFAAEARAADPRGGDPPARIESPPVMPGAVATTTIAVPVPPRAREARYRLTAYAGVRLYVDTTGALRGSGESTPLPITYAVSRTRAAGPMPIVRVEVTWADGTRWIGEMVARVQSRYSLRVALRVEPQGRSSALLRYAIYNTGNAPDTVTLRWDPGWSWQVDAEATPLVIAAGQRLEGVATARWPRTTPSGELRVVNLAVAGRGGVARASVAVRVPYGSDDERGLVRARSTVFLGSTVDAEGSTAPVIGVDANAAVSPDTRVALLYNRSAGGRDAQVVSASLLRQRFVLTVQRPTVTTTVGSVFRPNAALLGTMAQGSGATLDWRATADGTHVSVIVARPEEGALGAADRVLAASGDVPTALGRFGLVAASVSNAGGILTDSSSVRAGGVRYELTGDSEQHLTAELGAMRLTSGTAVRAGAAADLAYDGRLGSAALFARVHRVPAVLGSGEVMPSNAVAGGSVPVGGSVSLLGSAASADATLLGGPTSRSRSLSSGVGFSLWQASAQLLGTVRQLAGIGAAREQRGRTVTASLSVPAGGIALDGSAEVGRARIGDSTAISRVLRGGARWNGPRGWGWAGATYYSGAGTLRGLRLEGTGALTGRRATLEIGTAAGREARLSSLPDAAITLAPLDITTVWSRLRLTTRHGFDLMTGAEYLPRAVGASRWRVSVGVQQALDVPLPFRQGTSARGVVFEDLNGDGVRQDGEPGVAGVVLGAGDQHRQTGSTGAFSFVDGSVRGARLEVDATSLPDGYLVAPSARSMLARGRVDVPVYHAGSIVLVFHPETPDGVPGAAVAAPEGTTATVRAADGRARTENAVDGLVVVDGLPPGDYEVTVDVPPTTWRPAVSRTLRVRVGPGERARQEVMVPASERVIRFGATDPAAAPPSSGPVADPQRSTALRVAGEGSAAAAVPASPPDSSPRCGTACSTTPARAARTVASSSRSTAGPSRRNTSSTGTKAPRRPRPATTSPAPASAERSVTKRPSASRTSRRVGPKSAATAPLVLVRRTTRMNSALEPTVTSCLTVTVRCVRTSTVAALTPRTWLTAGTTMLAFKRTER